MQELKPILEEILSQLNRGIEVLNIDKLKVRIKELEDITSAPDFWSNQNQAKAINQELKHSQTLVEDWEKAKKDASELLELLPNMHPEEDAASAEEFRGMVKELQKRFDKLNRESFFAGKYDKNNAIINIHAGTGGKDAQDWAEILMRMYVRYAERVGYDVEVIDESYGEEVGLKSATISIKGIYAYAYLKGEKGVHRLVRMSPFNAKNSRETSFALIEILPEVTASDELDIKPEDIEFEAFRAGGKGGQNVNKVSSAVRIKHLPTGLVVTCQSERSQIQNREQAMGVLRAKLAQLMEDQHAQEMAQIKGGPVQIAWGNQIRSYVLHPYTMVKDHRTDYETSQVDKVLDGDLEGFIEAELEWMARKK
ncbi:peptide chain release factor 2 [Candidatus Gracilibacteria bacterium]|nr:peptide chain release factor 2 [Candidatus Gracilibacteria bacterium]